ncbi:helix-turn-helix domain-containing protein [Nonomuraea sp. NPDC049141]|uniref:helix-turn-helix domain-containing protein n=1 Tax=Nonomuraea sp. NPDC049141 TaxID=3155500 RepID=UPI0033CA7867
MAQHETRRISDLDELKAFTHPLRLKLYRALAVAGTATASQLADQADEAVSLISYHLRKLAALGLIEEAEPQSGDGRERWWQVVSQHLSARTQDPADPPETVAARTALARVAYQVQGELYERYLDEQPAWSAAWRTAAFSSEYMTTLTTEELRLLGQEIDAVIERWWAHGRTAQEAGDTEGREHVALQFFGFPFRA